MGFMGSFDMLFLVLKANYGEKICLLRIFSLVNTNAPGLMYMPTTPSAREINSVVRATVRSVTILTPHRPTLQCGERRRRMGPKMMTLFFLNSTNLECHTNKYPKPWIRNSLGILKYFILLLPFNLAMTLCRQ